MESPINARGQDSSQETEAAPFGQLTPLRIRAAFLDLLGRPPLRAERVQWADKGLVALLDELLGSEVFWAKWLEEQLYYFLLIDNFRPHAERVESIPADLAAGRLHVRDAIHRVVLSSSFNLRNPGSDTFVTVVMEQLLGIVVQKQARELDIGKTAYEGGTGLFLGQVVNSQSDVVGVAMADKRFGQGLVDREYIRLIRAEQDKSGRRDAIRAFGKDEFSFLDNYRKWFLSAEWEARLTRPRRTSNRDWVNSLFVDAYDRLPTDSEARRMRDALDGLSDPAPLKGLLARLVLDSKEAKLPAKQDVENVSKWIEQQFLALLGRSTTEEEAAVFTRAFREADCRPATILLAIVTGAEYQSQ
ncbi:MAG: hypothetical protein ACI9D0_000731 [Bacteroidia bacterium]|jgi:hypothetical protein